MKKYMAFGLTLWGVLSVEENVSGLAKPEVEKFVTNVPSAFGLLAERGVLRLLF